MSEMVERCAEALYTGGRPQGQPAIPWDRVDEQLGFGVRQSYRDQARALISAMREPTQAMSEAGGGELITWDRRFDGERAAAEWAWQEMIDEALK